MDCDDNGAPLLLDVLDAHPDEQTVQIERNDPLDPIDLLSGNVMPADNTDERRETHESNDVSPEPHGDASLPY